MRPWSQWVRKWAMLPFDDDEGMMVAGNRLKLATEARKAVQGRIAAWVREQPGTQQSLCRRLNVSPSQLTVLLTEGVERCSLEYMLDVWERCGGQYSLELKHAGAGAPGG